MSSSSDPPASVPMYSREDGDTLSRETRMAGPGRGGWVTGCGVSEVVLTGSDRLAGSEDVLPVHLAEGIGDQLDAGAVRVAEVHRDPAVHDVLDAGLGQPLDQLLPALGVD